MSILKLLVVDGSHMLQRSLHIEALWKFSNSKGVKTGGIYGFLNSLSKELGKFPDYYPVITWDAGLSPRRVNIYPEYKLYIDRTVGAIVNSSVTIEKLKELGLNDKVLDSVQESLTNLSKDQYNEIASTFNNPEDFRYQYSKQRDLLTSVLNELGIPSIRVRNWEGDDLMTLLVRLSDYSVTVTDDKDLIQLISPTNIIDRAMTNQILIYDEYMKLNNYSTPREVTIIKSIIGDVSDNIPSVTHGLERKYSLGEKRAKEVAKIIVDCNEDPNKYLPYLSSLGKNYYLGFVNNHDIYLRNLKLVDLELVPNDIEVISKIKKEILQYSGKHNYLGSYKLLSELEIYSFDLNSIISKLFSSFNLLKEEL